MNSLTISGRIPTQFHRYLKLAVSSENRSKYIALGVIGLLLVGLVFYYLTGDDPTANQVGDFGTAPVAQDMGEDVFGEDLVDDPDQPTHRADGYPYDGRACDGRDGCQ